MAAASEASHGLEDDVAHARHAAEGEREEVYRVREVLNNLKKSSSQNYVKLSVIAQNTRAQLQIAQAQAEAARAAENDARADEEAARRAAAAEVATVRSALEAEAGPYTTFVSSTTLSSVSPFVAA